MREAEYTRVAVSVRIRPKLECAVNEVHRTERYEKNACTVLSDSKLRLWDGKLTKESRSVTFSFDNVFDVDTPQEDLYEAAAVNAVDSVLAGTNASILTYGQTGSGKTYTVLGGIQNNPLSSDIVTEDTGLLMRAIEELLHYGAQMQKRKERHVVFGISVVEIYLDEIRDLLNPRSAQGTAINAAVMKDVVRLPGLTCSPLATLGDAMQVHKHASGRRVQRATSANDTSSRSHAVFSIEVFQVPFEADIDSISAGGGVLSLEDCLRVRDAHVAASLDPQRRPVVPVACAAFAGASNALMGSNECPIMYSKLTIADLAGSEKAKNANVKGEGFEELRKINASLTALGNVVHNLFEGAKHIPYRDSKLTMVLRDSFATPDARISLIVNVSPTVLTFEESLSSLYFADKVKAMKVKNVSNTQDAKLEEAYLASLRAHDALLADMHIFTCERELGGRDATFLPQAAALQHCKNPLFSTATHTAVSDNEEKRAAMAALLSAVREKRQQREAAGQTERFLKEQHRQTREEALAEYVLSRKAVRKELNAETAAVQALQLQEAAREKRMLAVLQSTHAAYVETKTTKQRLCKRKNEAMEKSVALQKAERQAAAQMQTLSQELARDPALFQSEATRAQEEALRTTQDATWTRVEACAFQVVELAELRQEWAALYTCNGMEVAERGRSVSSSPSSANAEVWLRHAVMAMAGNAVVQSLKRRQNGTAAAAGDRTHLDPGFLATMDTNRPHRYWTQKRLVEADQKKRPLRHSPFDDPHLKDTIAAFMDMGGTMRRLSRDGSLRRRLFYITARHGRKRLCWDEENHSQQAALRLGSMGCVELGAVNRILLGQCTPTFSRCVAGEDYFASFSLEYTSASSTKYLDLVCESVREMETWVIGLSQATGLSPAFSGASQPDGMDADAEEGDNAVITDLSPSALQLSREWHIPVSTLAEAMTQVNTRRGKHSNQVMHITPGELASVTRLDIFRGSALWLYLRREGLVGNPCKQLHCYVAEVQGPSSEGLGGKAVPTGDPDTTSGSSTKEKNSSQT